MSAPGALSCMRSSAHCVVSQYSVAELLDPCGSDMRSRCGSSRRESCSTLLMMPLTRSALLRMMSVSRRSSAASCLGFAEQLRGVAHGAHRIADLVRDARGQAPERGELRLLHLFLDERRVLEKDQHRRGIHAAERREMRPDHAPAIGRDEAFARIGRRAGAWRQVSSR